MQGEYWSGFSITIGELRSFLQEIESLGVAVETAPSQVIVTNSKKGKKKYNPRSKPPRLFLPIPPFDNAKDHQGLKVPQLFLDLFRDHIGVQREDFEEFLGNQ